MVQILLSSTLGELWLRRHERLLGAVGMLKVIGAGLSRTGTLSLHLALERLGFKSMHFDDTRLNDILAGSCANPDFRRYNDLDAVVDLPAAYFYRELFAAYPGSKVILTTRDVESWWRSVKHVFTVHPVAEVPRLKYRLAAKFGLGDAIREDQQDIFRRNLRRNVYGSSEPKEFLYKHRFIEHNTAVVATIPPENLLVMNIPGGDGWQKLCPFLGVPAPDEPFPLSHGTKYSLAEPERIRAMIEGERPGPSPVRMQC
jgi:hypothetical protein